jgi:phage FluMu gp28-like protein
LSEKLPPAIQLRPYQRRWIDDESRFKGAVKSARIGYSYATGLEAIFDCLEHPTTWTVLSASKAQSIEFVEQASKNIQAVGAVAQLYQDWFVDALGATDILVQRIQFSNGSRIMALPANPRTARGYPGNAILDEFAHHEDSYAIWAAVTRQVALGHKLRALSTPNGEQGKFYDLAKEFGLSDGMAPQSNPMRIGDWSWHWVDVHLAVKEGCPIDVAAMRDLIKDEDTFQQEFLCVFLKAAGAWLSIELLAMAEDAGATIDWPAEYQPLGPLYAGIDVARDHDKSVLWLDERLGDVAWTRLVLPLHATPFPQQHKLYQPWVQMATRTAIDSTGMGIALYDYLAESCPGRVMGINFAGTNDAGVKLKTDLAIRLKKRFELHLDRIPASPDIRQALLAIKRESTATGVKFDAPRIEVDTPSVGGPRKKLTAHADEFWAKALADLAAEHAAGGIVDFWKEEANTYHRDAETQRKAFGIGDFGFGSLAATPDSVLGAEIRNPNS